MWARGKSVPRLTFPRRYPQMSVQCPRNTAQHLESVHRGHNQGVKSSTSIDLQKLYLLAPFGIFFQCMMNQALRRAPHAAHKFSDLSYKSCLSLTALQPCLLLPCLNVCFYHGSSKMEDFSLWARLSHHMWPQTWSPWVWQLPPSQPGSHHSSYPQVL